MPIKVDIDSYLVDNNKIYKILYFNDLIDNIYKFCSSQSVLWEIIVGFIKVTKDSNLLKM